MGIRHSIYVMDENVTSELFLNTFDKVNEDPDVDGILLLRPLPSHLNDINIENRIRPEKDMEWN